MAVGFEAFSNVNVMSWLWLILQIVLGVLLSIAAVIGAIFYAKKAKLKYRLIVLRDLGSDKFMIDKITKAGKYWTRKYFFGLIDWGGQFEYIAADGNRLSSVSDSDLWPIAGKYGFIVMQSPTNPKIYLPINKGRITNSEIAMSIAPGDFTDEAIHLKRRSEREFSSALEKIMPYVAISIVAVVIMLIIIFTFQHMVGLYSELMKLAQMVYTQCGGSQNAILPSGAP